MIQDQTQKNITNTTDTSALQVQLIEPKAETIQQALGISDERSDELETIVERSYKKGMRSGETLMWVIEQCSSHAKHANELFFMSDHLVHHHKQNMNPLAMMFRSQKP